MRIIIYVKLCIRLRLFSLTSFSSPSLTLSASLNRGKVNLASQHVADPACSQGAISAVAGQCLRQQSIFRFFSIEVSKPRASPLHMEDGFVRTGVNKRTTHGVVSEPVFHTLAVADHCGAPMPATVAPFIHSPVYSE